LSPVCRESVPGTWARNMAAVLLPDILLVYVEPAERLVFPDAMKEWVREKYGDIETQQIVRVTNNPDPVRARSSTPSGHAARC